MGLDTSFFEELSGQSSLSGTSARDRLGPGGKGGAQSGPLPGGETLSCAEGSSCLLAVFIGPLRSFLLEWPKD